MSFRKGDDREKWTGVAPSHPDPGRRLGLFRRQAERHGMQTSDWGREPNVPQKKARRFPPNAPPGR